MARDKYTVDLYDFGDKRQCVDNYIRYMLNRTNQMFEYDGLPDTINERQLELHNQINGYTIWLNIDEDEIVQDDQTRHLDGGLYALYGGIGGVIDFNGDMTWATIAHPRLKESKRLKIGEECVVMRNDTLMMGLLPLYEKYATQLMENDITMNMADIESRIVTLMTAGNDKTKLSADMFMADIIRGKFSIITDKSFSEELALKTLPFANNANNTITNLIELQQYLKASLFNEIGLSANYNMKREAINSSEAQLGQDSLLPLVDDMLHSREEALEQVNQLFGTNISVHFHSAWDHSGEQQVEDGVMMEDDNMGVTGNEETMIADETQVKSKEIDNGEITDTETTTGIQENADNTEETPVNQEEAAEMNEEVSEDVKEPTDDVRNVIMPHDNSNTQLDIEEDEEVGGLSLEEISKIVGHDVTEDEIKYGHWVTIDDDDDPETPGRHVYIDDNGNFNNRAGFKNGKAVPNGTVDFPEDLEYGEDPGDARYTDAEPPESEEQLKDKPKGGKLTYDSIMNNKDVVKAEGISKLNQERVKDFVDGISTVLDFVGCQEWASDITVLNVFSNKGKPGDIASCGLWGNLSMGNAWFNKTADKKIAKSKETSEILRKYAEYEGKHYKPGGVDLLPEVDAKLGFSKTTGVHEGTHFIISRIVQSDPTRNLMDRTFAWKQSTIESHIYNKVSDIADAEGWSAEDRYSYYSTYAEENKSEWLAESLPVVVSGAGNKFVNTAVDILKEVVKGVKNGEYWDDVIDNYGRGNKDGK